MHGSSSVPQEYVDLVNKYGGNMPNARVCRGPDQFSGDEIRSLQGQHRHRPAPGLTAKIREVFATKPSEFDPATTSGPAAKPLSKRSSTSSRSSTAWESRSGH